MDIKLLKWGLKSFADTEKQERLWLSDGSCGEICSFEECVCCLFDGGLTHAMESGTIRKDCSETFCQDLELLGQLVQKIPHNISPKEQLNHPELEHIRIVARRLLNELKKLEDNMASLDLISEDEAIKIAQQHAEEQGWPWRGEVYCSLQSGWFSDTYYLVRSNASAKGCNVNIEINATDGRIRKAHFWPR